MPGQPPEPDVEAILTALSEHGVAYVLIGGMAAILQGVPLGRTLDVDITPARSERNERRLARALEAMDARLRAPGLEEGVAIPLDARTFRKMTTITFVTAHGPLDIAFLPDGTAGYADLRRDAVALDRYGVRVLVASVEDLIRSKEAAGREKDAIHLVVLRDFQRREG